MDAELRFLGVGSGVALSPRSPPTGTHHCIKSLAGNWRALHAENVRHTRYASGFRDVCHGTVSEGITSPSKKKSMSSNQYQHNYDDGLFNPTHLPTSDDDSSDHQDQRPSTTCSDKAPRNNLHVTDTSLIRFSQNDICKKFGNYCPILKCCPRLKDGIERNERYQEEKTRGAVPAPEWFTTYHDNKLQESTACGPPEVRRGKGFQGVCDGTPSEWVQEHRIEVDIVNGEYVALNNRTLYCYKMAGVDFVTVVVNHGALQRKGRKVCGLNINIRKER